MSDINFVTVDSGEILNTLIKTFEEHMGETLYPGDERRQFLYNFVPVLVSAYNSINNTGRGNLLRYAKGEVLDSLGEFWDCTRLPAQRARVSLKFSLSAAQPSSTHIPAGTRATPDGTIYFATLQELVIPAGQNQGTVTAEALVAGAASNGFAPGQIKTIVDPLGYVAAVVNTDTSTGGAEIEGDDDYRERIRLVPQSYSVAGPAGAYVYWAMSADNTIADVAVSSPEAGVVKIVPLLVDGGVPGELVLDKVLEAVNAKNRRPLTDHVQVRAPAQVPYDIALTYYISSANQANSTAIQESISGPGGAVDQFEAWQQAKLGRAINPDQLRYLIMQAGASRIAMSEPEYTELTADEVAVAGSITVTYGGIE